MKKIQIVLLMFAFVHASADQGYHYTVDLSRVVNDKITVSLVPPDQSGKEAELLFPAMVPGTYEVYDFGRFISNVTASGKNGAAIKVTKVNVNTYRFSPATAIEKITYQVDDTFDKNDLPGTKSKIIFEQGGSNFEDGKNFAMNTHCLFGYFRGMTNRDFTLEFRKPEGFYPATGLTDISLGGSTDIIRVNDYHVLADNPIMYYKPDTATVQVANTNVLVASYSPNKMISARFIAATLSELLNAQRDYLGGELPVNKYAFLFYFTDKPTLSGSHGALEHSYSSFYVMPEFDSLSLQQQLRDVSAHEFFHIVTPLTIHAKEIGDFDFNDPKMSAHLWLYEGMTEYAAHHAQVKAGIIEMNDFLNTMMQKYQTSVENFNDTMSFTWMSKHVLDEKIHKQYGNVYEKGAVIGMCLDILLRDLSKGEYGTQNLMKDLAKKYGKDRSFNDEDLFGDIEKFTYPEVGAFLRKHVGGGTPLPMEDILGRIGIDFKREVVSEEYSLGNPDLDYNAETRRLVITGTRNLDAFGKALGFKKGDEISALNGKEVQIENLKELITEYYQEIREGQKITVSIERPRMFNKKKYRSKTLSATARKVKTTRRFQIALKENISEQEKQTMRSWLGL